MKERSDSLHQPGVRLLLGGLAALVLVVMLFLSLRAQAAAGERVPATVDAAGVLTITASSDDTVRVTCNRGQVLINRADPDSGPATCGQITSLVVLGEPALDLEAVFARDFPELSRVRLEEADGRPARVLKRAQAPSGASMWLEEALALGPARRGEGVSASALSGEKGPLLQPNAPPLTTTIEAANFDTNFTHTGNYFIPPDPIAAAGPNHVVNVVNVSIEWYAKGGGPAQSSQALSTFFSALPAPLPRTFTFDPKVIYDQYHNRFVVVALERTDTSDGDPLNSSYIFLAVSDDSDPNGTWYLQAIDSKLNISGTDHWADYPGIAVDDKAIYVTNNMFPFGANPLPGGTRLWIVDKGVGGGGLYDGGTSAFTVHDPFAATGIAGYASTIQPAHMYGALPTSGAGEPVGTFLVEYSGITGSGMESINVMRVDDPLDPGGPTFSQQFVDVGDIDNVALGMPDAPQQGSAVAIETNDRRALQAVWRDNALWFTTQVVPSSGGDANQATAHWFKFDTSNLNNLTVSDQGNVGGNDVDPGAFTFFPALAVDQNGALALGFALSSPNHYAGAYYTCRTASDPPGTVQSTGALAAGTDYYVRTFGGPRNRWGDYSGMSLDPADGLTFWVYNEYATTRGSSTSPPPEDGRWGTRYGSFTCPSTSPTPTVTPTPGAIAPKGYLPAIRKRYPLPTPTPTPVPLTIPNGDFEGGHTAWMEFSSTGFDLIYHASALPVVPRSGVWAAWLGGAPNETSYLQQQLTVPPGSPILRYYHWIASADGCGNDFGSVRVNNTQVLVYDLCVGANTGAWVQVTVDLSAYAGQSVALQIWAETNGALNSNLYIDDVGFTTP